MFLIFQVYLEHYITLQEEDAIYKEIRLYNIFGYCRLESLPMYTEKVNNVKKRDLRIHPRTSHGLL
jgi:hypothetical protein